MSHELYKEFLCSQVLCFLVHRTELIITRKFFYQIVLCLNMLKISYSTHYWISYWTNTGCCVLLNWTTFLPPIDCLLYWPWYPSPTLLEVTLKSDVCSLPSSAGDEQVFTQELYYKVNSPARSVLLGWDAQKGFSQATKTTTWQK